MNEAPLSKCELKMAKLCFDTRELYLRLRFCEPSKFVAALAGSLDSVSFSPHAWEEVSNLC